MSPHGPPPAADARDEISALVETLHRTEKRLEELTAGEVDAVADQQGRTYLLRRAQERLRVSEAAKQMAILNALPSHVALIDPQGLIVSVNDAWREFAGTNVLLGPGYGIGMNYLEICEAARANHSLEASQVADGIRLVLGGHKKIFSIEYAGHSPTEQFWYRMAVTPLRGEAADGGVVMHVDISERKRAEVAVRRTTELLQAVADGTPDHVFVKDLDSRYLLCNEALASFLGHPVPDVIGRDNSTLLAPDEADAPTQSDRSVFESGRAFTTEYSLTSAASGAKRTFLSTKAPYRDERGEVIGLIGISRDISDRRQAELERDQERLFLRTLLNALPVGVYTKDLEGRFVIGNRATLEQYGFATEQELAGKTVFDLPGVQEPERVDEADRRVLAGEPLRAVHERVTDAQGASTWYSRIRVPLRDATGQVIGIVGIARNITDRKIAEQALVESRAMLTMAGRLGRIGAWSIDLVQESVFWSDEVCAIHEVPAGSAPSFTEGLAFYPPAWAEIIRQAFVRCIEAGTPFDLEVEIVTARCRHIWVRVIGEAVRVPGEATRRIQGAMQDVTIARAARRQLELLEASVSQLNDMVMITEATPQDEGGPRIVFVNDAFVRVSGYAREEAIGQAPGLLQGPLTDPAELARINAARIRREPVHSELLNYRKGGEPYWIELDVVPLRVEGEGFWHFVNVARDITERKRNEEALRKLNAELEGRVLERTADLSLARDEADRANQAKSAFLATMSHEIRTPMNGVIGMVDVLHQTSLRGYQVEMVDLIRDSAFSLLEIIEDILDFSKIEAGKLQIENEPMQIAGVVEKVCAMLDHMAAKAAVRMTLFVDPAIPPVVSGDATRLRQVLVNLAANAIKFSSGHQPPGQVSVRVVLVERQASLATVELIVTDNGIGMDDATVARLFTPFSQADASTTRRFGGTGLGLAISSMLVGLMGGNISVHSAPGQGSTFSVRLRFEVLDDATAGPAAPGAAAGLCCRIVGVELPLGDDLAACLLHAGATVERSADLAAAAATASAAPPAGLWLWLILPGPPVPPLDELRALAPRGPGTETRFIVLGHGQRRRPRVEAADMVRVDADFLFRRTLFEMLALASGRAGQSPVNEAADPKNDRAVAPTREQALLEGRLILVAEDNETNRKVILQQLRLIGFAAEVVVNGQEALERWRSGDYALLLTDLHMPVMDGYALAVAIRAEEAAGRHTPIIALTANAVRDEELHCRAVGMDAYLTKPIRLPQLKAAIEAGLDAAPQVHQASNSPPLDEARAPPADLQVLIDLVGDDPAVIHELLQAFRGSAALSSQEMAQGMQSGSVQAMAAASHKLRPAASSIGAARLAGICAEIEAAVRSARPEALGGLLQRFQAELDAVNRFLDST